MVQLNPTFTLQNHREQCLKSESKATSWMSSDFDGIRKVLKASQNDLDEANFFLSKEYPDQSEERKSANREFVIQNKVTKEIYVYLERLFRIVDAHRLQMIALYESIMSIPEVQANEQLRNQIKSRFAGVKDTQF